MKFNSIQKSINQSAVKTIFLGLLLLFFVFIVGSYLFQFSTEGMTDEPLKSELQLKKRIRKTYTNLNGCFDLLTKTVPQTPDNIESIGHMLDSSGNVSHLAKPRINDILENMIYNLNQLFEITSDSTIATSIATSITQAKKIKKQLDGLVAGQPVLHIDTDALKDGINKIIPPIKSKSATSTN